MASSDKYLSVPISGPYEADSFFITEGKYKFNPKLIGAAHKQCQFEAKYALKRGRSTIVSNTNIKPRDRKPYFEMAKEYGYKVVYIHLTTDYGSIHEVPMATVERMKNTYEDLSLSEEKVVVKKYTPELEGLLKEVGVL